MRFSRGKHYSVALLCAWASLAQAETPTEPPAAQPADGTPAMPAPAEPAPPAPAESPAAPQPAAATPTVEEQPKVSEISRRKIHDTVRKLDDLLGARP